MNKTTVIQAIRFVVMIVAIAGIIFALEYMNGGIAVWFWVTLLAVGFVGLLYSFRVTQRRVNAEKREAERRAKRKGGHSRH